MPTYQYEITNALGQPVCGSAGAESLPALAAQFAEQGWKVRRVLPDAAPAPFRYGRRVSSAEVSTFLRQLAVMLRNQVPVPEAVGLLARECRNPVFQTLIYGVERQVRAGEPLSAALAQYPRLFAPMQTATIESGEASNSLERVAEKLADYSEVVGMGVRRIRTAALYPLVVWCITSALILFVFAFIVPKYDALMRDLGMKELPLITQILVSASQSIVPIAIAAALPAVFLGAITLGMQPGRGAWFLDSWRLKLPVLGRLIESLALFRLSAMLSIFLDTRAPLLDALRLAGQSCDNSAIQGAVWSAIPRVAAGEPLGRSLDAAGVLPADFCGQVSVAEQNADLPETLHRLSRWHSERMESLTTRVGALLEPALIVCVGGCVCFVVLGLFLPLISIIRNLAGPG